MVIVLYLMVVLKEVQIYKISIIKSMILQEIKAKKF